MHFIAISKIITLEIEIMSNKYLKKIQNHFKKDKIYRIVFYGDSITSTEWVHPNWREIFQYVLQEELAKKTNICPEPSWLIRTINSGLTSATTADLAKKIQPYVLDFKPSLLILIAGKNDALFSIPAEVQVKNIEKICREIRKNNIDIIFATSTPTLKESLNRRYDAYAKAASKMLKRLNIQCVDLFNKYKHFNLKRLFTFRFEHGNKDFNVKPGGIDPAHPNQLGNAYIAKVLLKEIFDIEFDPELYIKDTYAGRKKPRY